jgi:hypothetical protein
MTQLRTGLRWGLGLLVAVGLLGMPGAAPAQGLSPRPRTFGTTSEIAHVLSAWDFNVANSQGQSVSLSGSYRVCVGGPCFFLAGVLLPAGALVTRVELDGCDNDPTQQLTFFLFRLASPNTTGMGTNLSIPGNTTGGAATPGCGVFSDDLISPETIDNEANTYQLHVVANTAVFFTAVRVYYTLQVSPAPAVATFSDVPTSHPFFQFVEALAASGITAGCGGGNYCPDAPLTRGQMAVFLSLGLGLHFAP